MIEHVVSSSDLLNHYFYGKSMSTQATNCKIQQNKELQMPSNQTPFNHYLPDIPWALAA